jgi:hypothetical protein
MKLKGMTILLALALISGLGIGWAIIAPNAAIACDPPGGGTGCK